MARNYKHIYSSSSHTTWWTSRGLGIRRIKGCLTWHQKTSGSGSQNHLKSYLQVPKTVTREEAYKGGQKLQTYIYPGRVQLLKEGRCVERQHSVSEHKPQELLGGIITVSTTLEPLLSTNCEILCVENFIFSAH